MKRFFKGTITTLSALSALVIAPVLLPAGQASAAPYTAQATETQASAIQPTGTNANYLGAGIAAGVTNGGNPGGDDDATFGGNVQARYAIPNTPVSLRGAALIGGESTALMPMLSVDVPVTNNANIYFGGGYSFVTDDSKPSPLGNQDAPVVTAGIESQVSKNIVLYGDAKLGIDAYQDSPADALSLQAGAAYRFN